MGFRMWLGGHFDNPHERRELMQLLQEAVARWKDEAVPFALFVDFQVGEARMDLVAVTDHALVVIDLKEGKAADGVVRGELNGKWAIDFPDGTQQKLNENRPKNPYQQVSGYRWEMINWLNANGCAMFGAQAAQSMNMSRIDAWVVVAPAIDEPATRRELASIYNTNPWFKVLGLDDLCDQLYATRQPTLLFDDARIAAMADALRLTEVRSFGGLLWPGDEALPITPLFSSPPLARHAIDRDEPLREALTALTGASPVATLVITGAEGSGKSHFARMIAQELQKRGRRCLWADCGREGRTEVTVETLLLALANEMPPGMHRQTLADRYVPFDHRMRTALDWCDREELVIVFDDYGALTAGHDIGKFVRRLDACCRRAQIIVTTARKPDFLADPSNPLDAALTIEVGGLDAQFVAPFLEMRSVADRLHLRMEGVDALAIWEKTGGMPFLLNILAHLSRNGAPDEVAASVVGHAQAQDWIDRMLSMLSADARRLANAASVARHALDADFLGALADAGKGPALISEMVDANVLMGLGENRYMLTGGLRAYFAEKMPPETRRKAHERAMKHLAQRAADRERGWVADLEEATWHALVAEKWHATLQYAEAAGEELQRLGEHRRLLPVCERAASAAQRLNDAKQVARWQVAQASALRHIGRQEEAEGLCRAALDVKHQVPTDVTARAYHVLAGIALDRSDFDAARDHCRQALAQYLSLKDNASEAARLTQEAETAMRAGDIEAAYSKYRASFAASAGSFQQGGEQPADLARRHFDFGLVEKYDHNLAAALAHFDEALRYADRAGGPGQVAVILGQLAEVQGRLGRFEYALNLVDSSLSLRREMSDAVGVPITLGIRTDIFLEARDAAGAREALGRVEEAVGDSVEPVTVAFLNKRRGLLALLEGREAEGLALVNKALEAFRLLGKKHWVADCEETLARMRTRQEKQMRLPLEG